MPETKSTFYLHEHELREDKGLIMGLDIGPIANFHVSVQIFQNATEEAVKENSMPEFWSYRLAADDTDNHQIEAKIYAPVGESPQALTEVQRAWVEKMLVRKKNGFDQPNDHTQSSLATTAESNDGTGSIYTFMTLKDIKFNDSAIRQRWQEDEQAAPSGSEPSETANTA